MEGDGIMGGFSHGQQRTIVLATQAAAVLSFTGSIIIVFANFRFKQLRTYSFQLVVWFAVCDIFVDLSFFMGTPQDGSAGCYAQASLLQFFQIASIQWTVLISQSLLAVASKSGTFDGSKRMLWNHLWAWGVSAVLTFGPSATNSYGESEAAFCMIQTTEPWDMGSVWRLIFVAVCALSIAFVAWTHLSVARYLHRAQRGVYLLTSHGCDNPSSIAAPLQTYSSRANVAPPSLLPNKTAEIAPPRIVAATESVVRNPDAVACARVSESEKPDGALTHPGLSDHHPREAQMEGSLVVAEQDVARAEKGVNVGSTSDRATGKPPVAPSSTAWRGLPMRRSSSVSVHGGGAGSTHAQGMPNVPNGSAGVGQGRDDDTHASRTRWTSGASSVRSGGSSSQVNAKNWLWSVSKAGVFAEERTAFITDNDDFLSDDPGAETLTTVYGAANRPLPCPMPAPSLRHGIRPGGGVRGRRISKKYPITAAPRGVAVSSTSLHSSQMAQSALDFGARKLNVSHTGIDGVPVIARTHPRPLGLRVKDRAGRMRSWVRSMSSNDVDPATASHLEGDENRRGNEKSIRSPVRVERPPPLGTGALVRTDSVASCQSRGSVATVMSQATARRRRNTVGATDMRKFVSRVKWYPVIYALCWVFTLVNGLVIVVIGQNNAIFTLVLLGMVTARLQGLLNFLYYGLNDRLKQAWFQDVLYRHIASACSCSQFCCFISTKHSDSSRRKYMLPAGSLYRRSQVPLNSMNNTSEEDTTDTARPPSTNSAAATAAAQQPSREMSQGAGITRVQVTTIEKHGKHGRHTSTAAAAAAAAAASTDAKGSSPVANQTRLSYKKQDSATMFTTPKPDQYRHMGPSAFAATPERPQRPPRGSCGAEGFDGVGGLPPRSEAVSRKKNRGCGGANARKKHHPPDRAAIPPPHPHMEASHEDERRSRRKPIKRPVVEASATKGRGEEDEHTRAEHRRDPIDIGTNGGGEKCGKVEGSGHREGGKGSKDERETVAVWSRRPMKPPVRAISPKLRARPKVVVASMPRTRYRATAANNSTRSLGGRGGEVILTAQQLFRQYSSSDIKSDVSSEAVSDGGEGVSGEGVSGEGRGCGYGLAEDEESGYAAEGSGVETEVELFDRATTEASSFFSDDGESMDSFVSSGFSESSTG